MFSVSATAFDPIGVANVNTAYHLATFTTTDSPAKLTNYSVTVSLEDGTADKPQIKFAKGVFSVTMKQKFPSPGTDIAQVTIHDKLDGSSQTVTSTITVGEPKNYKGFTIVSPALTQWFQEAFGGSWKASGKYNYTDHQLTATRLSDRKDIDWSGNVFSASLVPTPAFNSESFGYFAGNSGGSYVNLFNATGNNSSGGVGFTEMPPIFRLARTGNDGNTFTSNPADSVDRRVHMVAFLIKGLVEAANQTTYLICWEDSTNIYDIDYKDLIVELTLQT